MATAKPSSETAPAKPDDPEAIVRREVLRLLRGPVADVFKTLVPALSELPDPYKITIDSPELLDQCIKLFHGRREAFAEFLIDAQGRSVKDNATRLKCGRSVDEVIGMMVRSSMRSYAEQYFGDTIDKPAEGAKTAVKSAPAKSGGAVGRLANALKGKNAEAAAPVPKGVSRSGRFYNAIKDYLDLEWQIPFFPIYIEMPPSLFGKLGRGITRMDSIERLQRLIEIDAAEFSRADRVIVDAATRREMYDNNALAVPTISLMGQRNFETLHDALAHLDPRKRWDVFANKATAMQLADDKRINKNDIVALAEYLDILNEDALSALFDLQLNRDQMRMFLKTGEEKLGHMVFMALFGPQPEAHSDEQRAVELQRKFIGYTQTALRSLVQAVKTLEENIKRRDPEAVSKALAIVCESRRNELLRDVTKLRTELEKV